MTTATIRDEMATAKRHLDRAIVLAEDACEGVLAERLTKAFDLIEEAERD